MPLSCLLPVPFADFNVPIAFAFCPLTLTLCFLPFAFGLLSSAYCFILPLVQAMIREGGDPHFYTHNWPWLVQEGIS